MKNLLMLTAVLMATSCVDFKGNFTVHETIAMKHTTIFGKTKTVKVPKGVYKAEFDLLASNKIKLTFKKPGDDISVKIKLPKNTNLPSHNGTLNLKASQSGQPNDIFAQLNTEISESSVSRGTESCSYTQIETQCRVECSAPNECQKVCEDVEVTIQGKKFVKYYYKYTDKFLELEVTKPNSSVILGEYSAQSNDVDKIYTFQGPCKI